MTITTTALEPLELPMPEPEDEDKDDFDPYPEYDKTLEDFYAINDDEIPF